MNIKVNIDGEEYKNDIQNILLEPVQAYNDKGDVVTYFKIILVIDRFTTYAVNTVCWRQIGDTLFIKTLNS